MDIFEETKAPLVALWKNDQARQSAKLVIFQAIANATDLSAKEVDAITDELDRLLSDDSEETPAQRNRGLNHDTKVGKMLLNRDKTHKNVKTP